MSETAEEAVAGTEAAPAAGGVNTETAASEVNDDGPIPRTRLNKEINAKKDALIALKTANDKLAQIEKDQKLVRDEKLIQDGEIKTLLSESKDLLSDQEKELEKYRETDQSRREVLLSELSEESKAIYEDLPLDKLEAHVKTVRGAGANNSGMANASSASSTTETSEPQSTTNMDRRERAKTHNSRLNAYFEKHGGLDLNAMRARTNGRVMPD